jgi:hypothetical protein
LQRDLPITPNGLWFATVDFPRLLLPGARSRSIRGRYVTIPFGPKNSSYRFFSAISGLRRVRERRQVGLGRAWSWHLGRSFRIVLSENGARRAFARAPHSSAMAGSTSGCTVHAQPFKRRRTPHLPDHDGGGLLLIGETPERFLFVGVGLENGQKLGYLHEVVHSLLQVQQFHLAASVGDGGIAAD